MVEWLQAVLLGAIQGLTEFLPVSSSGHLVLSQAWLGDDFLAASNPLFFDLVLHLGTLLPILWFYRADLASVLASFTGGQGVAASGGPVAWLRADPSRWLAAMVILGSVPTAAIGLSLEEHFEELFSSVLPVCIALLATAVLLVATRWTPEPRGPAALTWKAALLIGLIQGVAIIPGISRSGSTIALALFLGLERDLAARFSFLLSVPAIAGAILIKGIKDGPELLGAGIDWFPLLCGFLSAAVVGYLALVLLVGIVKKGGLHRFAWYLVPASLLAWLTLS